MMVHDRYITSGYNHFIKNVNLQTSPFVLSKPVHNLLKTGNAIRCLRNALKVLWPINQVCSMKVLPSISICTHLKPNYSAPNKFTKDNGPHLVKPAVHALFAMVAKNAAYVGKSKHYLSITFIRISFRSFQAFTFAAASQD